MSSRARTARWGWSPATGPSNCYDPGSSWSGGDLEFAAGATLDDEIAVEVRDGGEGNA